MTQFVYAGDRYVRLSDIKEIRISDHGQYSLWGDEGLIYDNAPTIFEHLTSIIPVTGEWECLFRVYDVDEVTYEAESIIAWGLTVKGKTMPVTPSSLEGVFNEWALRKVGGEEVYSNAGMFRNVEDWFNSGESREA